MKTSHKISTLCFCKKRFLLMGQCRNILAVSILTTRLETNATTSLKQKERWQPHEK